MNNSVIISFWGARGSTPCANVENMHFGGNTTCLQIKIPDSDELLILDCGTGFRNLGKMLAESGKPQSGRIFITHPHWDHLQGFPFFKPFYNRQNQFHIYIPPQGGMSCKDILQGHMSGTFFPVSMDMLDAEIQCDTFFQGKQEFPGFSIDYMWAHHTIPTAIFKIEVADKTIVFAPDNELPIDSTVESRSFMETFRGFIHGADVLIHDAQFSMKQYEKRQGWGHSAWEKVIETAREEKVKQLCLTHHDPDSTDEYLFRVSDEIQKNHYSDFHHLCLIKEGHEITLPLANIKEFQPAKN